MSNVIVFNPNGEIQLATLKNPTMLISLDNLTNFEPCPETLLSSVPSEIIESCAAKCNKVTFIYFTFDEINSQWEWKAVS